MITHGRGRRPPALAGRLPLEVRPEHPRRLGVAPDVEAANVHLPGAPNSTGTDYDPTLTPDWVKGLVDECAAFPNAAHDDQVDALSQALLRLAGQSGIYRQKGGKTTRTGGMKTKDL